MFVEYYGRTDVGRKRQHNEDTFYFSKGNSFCAVADGMGGRKSGEVASKLAVDNLRKHFQYYAPAPPRNGAPFQEVKRSIVMISTLLKDWIQKINSEIFEMGTQAAHRGRGGNMGTTLVLLHVYDRYGIVAHVGDSRLYRLREADGIEQITADHSLLNRHLKEKRITEEEARHSKIRNIVTRALGTQPTVEPEIQVTQVEDGDIYLLCSDGLSDLVRNEEIGDIVLNNVEDLDFAVAKLIDLANARGGKDNITVVLAQTFDIPDRGGAS